MGLKLYYDPIAERDVGWLYPPGRAIKFERTGDAFRGTSSLDVSRRRFRFDPRQWEITDERDLFPQIGDRGETASGKWRRLTTTSTGSTTCCCSAS